MKESYRVLMSESMGDYMDYYMGDGMCMTTCINMGELTHGQFMVDFMGDYIGDYMEEYMEDNIND